MKKLDKYKAVIKKIKGNLEKLEDYGFELRYVTGVTGEIFVNEKEGVVIKSNYRVSPKKPRIAIPTVTVKLKRKGHVNIQPLADVSYKARKKALEKLKNKLSYKEYSMMEDDFDMHDDNVAMYGKRAVVIDW